ncbi:hypothetical protein PQU61_20480, partial [Xanthomonas protegens]
MVERQILVRLRVEDLPARAVQQFRHRRLATQFDAQCEGIDEETDQRFDLGPVATSHRAADHHLFLPGQAAQQRRPARQQSHVERYAMALAQCFELSGQGRIEHDIQGAAGEVLIRRARAIGRHFDQGRCAGEGFPPVRGLSLQLAIGQPLPLPLRIVDVL